VLVAGRRAAIAAGVEFLLVNPQPGVRRILTITGLDRAFRIDPPAPAQRPASS
jgi:anti-anti-sigma regulatory factor